jgi:hypothetical protein
MASAGAATATAARITTISPAGGNAEIADQIHAAPRTGIGDSGGREPGELAARAR